MHMHSISLRSRSIMELMVVLLCATACSALEPLGVVSQQLLASLSMTSRPPCAENSVQGCRASKPLMSKRKKKARASAKQAVPVVSSIDDDDLSLLTAEERGQRALEAMRKSSGSDLDLQRKKQPELTSQQLAEERGRRLLETMRKNKDSEPDLLQKKRGMKLTPEELAPEENSVMPDAVADRMLKRIIPFAALPTIGGVVLFAGFYLGTTQFDLDVPPTIVAYATQATLLLSFAGITYGVMSTELEEGEEQTPIGAKNVKRNLDIMRGKDEQ